MEVTELLSLNQLIPLMRGEISEPLIQELESVLLQGMLVGHSRASVQIPSGMVTRGLTLVLHLSTHRGTVAAIYLARPEIPGYLPLDVTRKLHDSGWSTYHDNYGQKYAVISRTFPSMDTTHTAGELAIALEILGAPQKHSWELKAFYE